MMRDRRVIAVSAGAVLLIGVLLSWAWLMSNVKITVVDSLGPQAPEWWRLVRQGAPLHQVQIAVRTTGASPDSLHLDGSSILAHAAFNGRRDVVAWLLEQGADPNGHDVSDSPLLDAISRGHVEIVEMLLQNGADPDVDVSGGRFPRSTPRWHASHTHRSKPIIELIERYVPWESVKHKYDAKGARLDDTVAGD
jgi:hypothetical protein